MGFVSSFIIAIKNLSNLKNNTPQIEKNSDNIENVKQNNLATINDFQKVNFFNNKIPQEITNLLWFADGPCKNYDVPVREYEYFSISSSNDIEPSAIYMNLPIEEGYCEALGYYPKYYDLSPIQRYTYLNWLTDVKQNINIGYVFLFYYGLERHIILGKYENAFDMILKLRKYHKNLSFLGYSQDILLYCCVLHNRIDLFNEFLKETPIDEIEITDLYLACAKNANLNLLPQQIMRMSSLVGFKNKRYIKAEPDLFCLKLEEIIKNDNFDLSKYQFDMNNKTTQMLFANFSGDLHKARHLELPSLSDNNEFKNDICELLNLAHEATKEELKQRRKKTK